MGKIKSVLSKVKKRIVKKVTLRNIYARDEKLYCLFELSNFIKPIKQVDIYLNTNDIRKKVTHRLEKGRLFVEANCDDISFFDSSFKLSIYIDNQKMWITESDSLSKEISFVLNKTYYTAEVNKDLLIRQPFNEVSIAKSPLTIKKLEVIDNKLYCKLDDFSIGNEAEDVKVYGLKYNKLIEMNTTIVKDSSRFKVDDFTLFSNGLWRIFLGIDGILYPLTTKQEHFQSLYSVNHGISIHNINKKVYFNFTTHVRRSITDVQISMNELKQFEMTFANFCPNEKYDYKFIVRDVTNGEEIVLDTCVNNNDLKTLVHLDDLTESFSRKSFFVMTYEQETPIKIYQFDLGQVFKHDQIVKFDLVKNSEILYLLFYRRRDNSLGLRINRPKINKIITRVKNNQIKGEIGSLERFVNCKSYLIVEDRHTKVYVKHEIKGRFNLDLLDFQLLSLKGKEKTVMDFFVIIEDANTEVIRKEKIKYKYSDYKKDNYYASINLKDSKDNHHYFLLTTTPFNNLKIESFMLPHYIDLNYDYSRKDENIWLIGERYDTAQDNGIVLYKWLRENTDIDAYYVIDSEAKDYLDIQADPHVLRFGSPEHYEIAFKAKVLLGTHDLENLLPYKPARGFFNYEDTYKVFLQHGVLGRKNVEYHKKYYDLPFDLFIVSSDPEKYDVVVDRLGYEEEDVAVTGLARFDNLQRENQAQDILLMPTWRDWINTDEQFLNSDYFKLYSSLIRNEDLLQLLDEYDINLNFYPHYRAQEYFKSDLASLDKRINFIELGSKKVQDLLIEHALLITDFSSVSFDFTLMNKPVIYYHFDVRRFFRQGILRPIEETFIGRIAETEDELVDFIKDRVVNDFKNYEVDISNVLKFQDSSNSERIYKAILSHINKKA